MNAKALILAPFTDEYLDRLRQHGPVTYEPWTETRRVQNPDALADRLRDERVNLVVVEADFLRESAFAVGSLKLAGCVRNGLNLIDLEAATKHRVPVINAPGRNAVAVAELTIGLMLALARHIPAAHAFTVDGRWDNPYDAYIGFRGRELASSVVGILGFGGIGRETAKRARCLGARVIAHDPYASPRRAQAIGARLVSFESLLRRADFLTLHTALTPETEKMLDGDALDLMQPSAYIVSVGANNLFDDDALAARLRERRIAGAALDVFRGHFMAADSPFRGLANVILTPHIGGATRETIVRQSRMITEDIERFLRGGRPRRIANPDALTAGSRGR
ncbi:MAG: NAD(P)-dependent oxidoreductase [Dehalococcoidia bacterium]